MATYAARDFAPVLKAATTWAQQCMVGDGSVLGRETLWTAENFALLDRFFVRQLDQGDGDFYQKLEGQMAKAPPSAPKLMAELLWLLFLFPSNTGPQSKREGIERTWKLSGEQLELDQPMLSDAVLAGIGSAGTAFNAGRWKEVIYAIGLFTAVKQLPASKRAALVRDYDQLSEWLQRLPREGNRQFRHMLRFMLFPSRVESMSSNSDRRRVLEGFGVATKSEMRDWSDRQFDDELVKLRDELEIVHNTKSLDFYRQPLVGRWKTGDGPEVVEPPPPPSRPPVTPLNQIFFGPPGTGKTYHLQQLLQRDYTEAAGMADSAAWRSEQIATRIATLTWWEASGAALYDLGKPTSVPQLAKHPYIVAVAAAKGRNKGLGETLWGTLRSHALLESNNVISAQKLAPFVFEKTEDSTWRLAGEWKEQLAEVVEIVDAIRQGPKPTGEPVRRYAFVSFHQSFSYEDFMEGLTPVNDDATGTLRYEIKRGVFLRLCERARTDPSHAYAMVIDEINRANVSKVFGELITLIETDKREGTAHAVSLTLPYSGATFSVPSNVHIIGTMNTADRSLAGLDIALRRRFQFVEMPPKPELLDDVNVAGINVGAMLSVMNQRIEVLLDRDHQLGHAYFMSLEDGDVLSKLADIFRHQILPLLQEYFFEDWQRIAWVLNDQRKPSAHCFVVQSTTNVTTLFGSNAEVPMDAKLWQLNLPAFERPESYLGIVTTGPI